MYCIGQAPLCITLEKSHPGGDILLLLINSMKKTVNPEIISAVHVSFRQA